MSKFPDFDEFLASIEGEVERGLTEPIHKAAADIRVPVTDEEFSRFFTKAAGAGYDAAKNLIRRYHEWLAEHYQSSAH